LKKKKKAILKQMRENLEKGYGLDKDKSKVLEALKEQGKLIENISPKTPEEISTKNKKK
jgi:hypothetical protein